MKKNIIIIGDGILARILCRFPRVLGYVTPRNIDEILDPETGKVLGRVQKQKHVGVIGIAHPEYKAESAEEWLKRGRRLGTLIHPDTTIIGKVEIGEGSVIFPQAIILGESRIGKSCVIGAQTIIHTSNIGDYCHITLGVKIISATIEKEVILGSGVIVLDSRIVGTRSIVGAGSIVHQNIPPNYKFIQKNKKDHLVRKEKGMVWTQDYLNKKFLNRDRSSKSLN